MIALVQGIVLKEEAFRFVEIIDGCVLKVEQIVPLQDDLDLAEMSHHVGEGVDLRGEVENGHQFDAVAVDDFT